MLTDDLPTPCLLLNEKRLQANIDAMQAKAEAQQVRLRPHIKTHKSITLARRQREAGARDITVAKVGEAETFAEAGFDDIRLAYTIVGDEKHERLLRLAGDTQISFCVDTLEGARAASTFYEAHGQRAQVLIEIDVGYGRCGVRWDDAHLVSFVRAVTDLPGLILKGILTHAGQGYHGPQEEDADEAAALKRVSRQERDRMLQVAATLQEAGIPGVRPGGFEISIGSTPSMRYFENAEHEGFRITEIRPGNYVVNDAIQVGLGAAALKECALTVLSTVISKHRDPDGRERFFLDAGKKILTSDTGANTDGHGILLYNPAAMVPMPHARITGLSEEHGWGLVAGGATLAVGDRVQIVPNHACTTIHTQDQLYLVDGDDVIERWHIDARGRSW